MLQTKNVYWFTGLSGAGKTTLGRAFVERIQRFGHHPVFLDGDELREVLRATTKHSIEERRELAFTYSRFCKLLVAQGFDVVCCTVSMFEDVRIWNRENIPGYREIYVKASRTALHNRDQKGLYSGVAVGTVKNVVGLDLNFDEPRFPDAVVDNDGTMTPDMIAEALFQDLRVGDKNYD